MPSRPPSACLTPRCPNTTTGATLCTSCASTACKVTLVCGPPCAGKNTYVTEHAHAGDLIVDLDALYTALGARGDHDQPLTLKPFAFAARDALLDRLWTGNHELDAAWIILSAPESETRDLFHQRGVRIVLLDPGRDECLRRAEQQRPPEWASYIHNWYTTHSETMQPIQPSLA